MKDIFFGNFNKFYFEGEKPYYYLQNHSKNKSFLRKYVLLLP